MIEAAAEYNGLEPPVRDVLGTVESKRGAVLWADWPATRFLAPLIEQARCRNHRARLTTK
jgi:hypothetical protein